jgi:hypothetical protein
VNNRKQKEKRNIFIPPAFPGRPGQKIHRTWPGLIMWKKFRNFSEAIRVNPYKNRV